MNSLLVLTPSIISSSRALLNRLTKPKYAEELAGGAVLKLADDEISQLERLADSFGIVSKGVWEPKVERK